MTLHLLMLNFICHIASTPPISQSGQIQMLKSIRIVHFFKFGNHLSSPFLHRLEFVNVRIFCMVPKQSYNIPNATLPNVYTIKEMPFYHFFEIPFDQP